MSLFNHLVELKYLLEKVTIGVHGAQSHPQSSWGNSTMAWTGESTRTQANKDALKCTYNTWLSNMHVLLARFSQQLFSKFLQMPQRLK
jgi:hypothetical protein